MATVNPHYKKQNSVCSQNKARLALPVVLLVLFLVVRWWSGLNNNSYDYAFGTVDNNEVVGGEKRSSSVRDNKDDTARADEIGALQEKVKELSERVKELSSENDALKSEKEEDFDNKATATTAEKTLPPNSVAASTTSTTSIVEFNDPELHKTATVMAMATGYGLRDYQRYVGSLRKTGYGGNIILIVAPTIGKKEEEYLESKGVVVHKVKYTECSHPVSKELAEKAKKGELTGHAKEIVTCIDPYPKLKNRWARFPLLRDLLKECGGLPDPEVKCGGPVLVSDLRDTVFQRNPFGPDAPRVHGLQVFEEHYTIRTTHWLTNWPIGDCKGVRYDEPMLCSGTTIGTRRAMLDYLNVFHAEMDAWMEDPKCCCFETSADDQSMHNYLYYSGALANVTGGVRAVKNRDGLVHTVGAIGSLIWNTNKDQKKILREAQNDPKRPPNDSHNDGFDLSSEETKNKGGGGKKKNWLGLHYGMTDKQGYFVDFDGGRSFVIHQYDRFGLQYVHWMEENKNDLFLP